jgi:hypothetical protein
VNAKLIGFQYVAFCLHYSGCYGFSMQRFVYIIVAVMDFSGQHFFYIIVAVMDFSMQHFVYIIVVFTCMPFNCILSFNFQIFFLHC